VAGFDNIDLCQYVRPPLTTVRQDPVAMGTRAVQALLDMIGNSASTPPISLPTELVVRASTGAPPLARRARNGARARPTRGESY
jgi:LacI family transcriptional regulator